MLLRPKFPSACYAVFGLIFFLSGVILLFSQTYMKTKIIEMTRLVNGSEGFDNWMHPKAPLTMKFYLFNITNMDEFLKGGKPSFVEIGPYVYREIKSKEIGFTRNGYITYRDRKVYYFDASNGLSANDTIFTLNLPMMVISRLVDNKLPDMLLEFFSLLFEKEPLLLKLSVHEVLWGYNATLFDLINKELHRFHLPAINFPQFGIFSQGSGNGSYGEEFAIKTGEGGASMVGEIFKWDHKEQLSFWSGDYCNDIRGTDGSLFHPFTTSSQNLSIFSTDICRSLTLAYNLTSPIYNIPTLLFTIPPEAFQSYHTVPQNQCFCVPDKLKCLKSGVLDISPCKMGAPIVVSLPHFLHADLEYLTAVSGLHPSTLQHRTNLFVEPSTGIVLKAEKRLQINFLLDNYPFFKATHNISKLLVYPVMWLEEAGSIDQENAGLMYWQLTFKVKLLNGLIGAFVTLGVMATVVMVVQGVLTFIHFLPL